MKCFAVRHCPDKSEKLENIITGIHKKVNAPYSFGNKKADGSMIYVIQTSDTKPVQYDLGYRYKVSTSEKPAGGGKWNDTYIFKHLAAYPIICEYFEKLPRIESDDFRSWFASSERTIQGMCELPSEYIKLLDSMIDDPSKLVQSVE